MVLGDGVEAGQEIGRIEHLKADVDGRGALVLILDLGFGQRRTAVGAPVDRLGAFGQMAACGDLAQCPDDVGLEREVHRQVRALPVTEHAETDEVGALGVDLFGCVGTAGGAECRRLDLDAGLADLLLDLQFDRQPMAVPAGDIGRVVAAQRLALDDDVLEHLVDGMADMNRAVRVRRAIVQHELRAPFELLPNRGVQVLVGPALQLFGFALRQIGLHREGGLGEIQCALVVHARDAMSTTSGPKRAEEIPSRRDVAPDLGLQCGEIGELALVP